MRSQATSKFHVVTDPEPDERSGEEQRLSNLVYDMMDNQVLGVTVAAAAPGTPRRFIRVAVTLSPIRYWKFRQRRRAIVQALKQMVEPDADVDAMRLPTALGLRLYVLSKVTP